METITSIDALRARLLPHRRDGRTIGLVPTMGFLHHGHMTLVARARAESDIVVLTIFVNPTQFAPNEDYSSYPRNLERDLELCRQNGVDIVFTPSVEEMYPEPMETSVDVASLSPILIGIARPTHFRGVATVVAKLLNIAEPDRAFFGEKDFQQLTIIRKMARDLSMRAEIVGVPTVREPDGLASSSRNVRLTPEDRVAASVVPRAMARADEMAKAGERDPERVVAAMREIFAAEPRAEVKSIDIRHARTLAPVSDLDDQPAVALVTVRFGAVTLIDQRELGQAEGGGQ